MGGSQGSQIINNHIYKNISYYNNQKFQLFLQCGKNNYKSIPKEINETKNIIIKKFIEDMSIIYSAADLVISRSGALAISELCYMGKAMILIPFRFAADNHQELNANEIKKRVNVGFEIYTDKYRFVASNLEGFKLFSFDDSEQKHNIWENEGLYYKNIHEKINHFPIIKELYSKIKSDKFDVTIL